MFGIIQGINSKDDPLLWKALHSTNEIIFSNVLVTENGKAHWLGKDCEIPKKGFNHSGKWWLGKEDANGREIPCSHPNARFTFELKILENLDLLALENPNGVVIKGIVYSSRDSDTSVPIEESFDWVHSIITKGASLESETTVATLGKEGVREFNPISNLDFLPLPIGKYTRMNLDFGSDLKNPPIIFGVNYFLKGETSTFLNDIIDKKVWFKWMELRVHREVEAIATPTGKIPKYEDLKKLFEEILDKNYSEKDYVKQFTIRVPENLAKIDGIINIYKTRVSDTPEIVFKVLEEQRQRLIGAREKYGSYISPMQLQT